MRYPRSDTQDYFRVLVWEDSEDRYGSGKVPRITTTSPLYVQLRSLRENTTAEYSR